MSIDRFLEHSVKIDTSDIDWQEGKKAGLTSDERFILTYFSDIESQTIIYLRDLLHTKAAYEPDTVAFLSMWNYEEYFHGHALAQLMAACGYPLENERIKKVRKSSRLTEKFKAAGASIFSKVFQKHFPALFMTWGAINEITTLHGYECLNEMTHNPVLKTLCERIAKQERRHFAWYFNSARKRLEESKKTRNLTRKVLKKFWSPVGDGVKTKNEVGQLIQTLFPKEKMKIMAHTVDSRISQLPGLEGLELMGNYLIKQSLTK